MIPSSQPPSASLSSASTSTSTNKLIKTPMETMITKASLSNKKNEQMPAMSSLKQTGAELKKAIMQDSSLLLKSSSGLKGANGSTGGGYKDLVLSVLKKKSTTTA